MLPHLPEAKDPARQRSPLRVLLLLDEHQPILSFVESPARGSRWDLSGLHNIEDEDATERQRIVYTTKENDQSLTSVIRIEQVVEDLEDCRDGLPQRTLTISGSRRLLQSPAPWMEASLASGAGSP